MEARVECLRTTTTLGKRYYSGIMLWGNKRVYFDGRHTAYNTEGKRPSTELKPHSYTIQAIQPKALITLDITNC